MEFITSENILLVGSTILVAGILIGKLSYRIGLPVLLIFLLVGIGFGSDGIGIHFNSMDTAQFIGMIALCIILFSGGLSTKYSAIKPIISAGLALSTAGVFLTALFTGLFIWWLSGMAWTNIFFAFLPSLLLASTMSSTDSASVFGILGSQKVGLKHNLRQILELESGSNDPMAYMLTIILIEAMQTDYGLSAWNIVWQLILQFAVGGAMGYVMGRITRWIITVYSRIGAKKGKTEDSIQRASMVAIMVLGMVFLTFSLTTDFSGNGYLAVYIMGIYLGNTSLQTMKSVTKIVDGFTWLSQVVVFLMLGLLVNPKEMLAVTPVSLLIGAFMIFVSRPASVFLTLLPFRKITLRSKTFISWVGLRGAVPIIFATYPVVAGVEGASSIFNIVFFVTLLSLLIQGTTIIPVARKLNLTCKSDDEDTFGVELPDEMPQTLETITMTQNTLSSGNTLKDITLPDGSLVIVIQRGSKYIVPNGTRKLLPGDKLLLIRDTSVTL